MTRNPQKRPSPRNWETETQTTGILNGADLLAAASGAIPTAQGDGTMVMELPDGTLVQAGRYSSATGISGSSDGTWDTDNSIFKSISFPQAFDATPVVLADIVDNENANHPETIRAIPQSVSTTGFDVNIYNFSSTNESDQTIAWIATEES